MPQLVVAYAAYAAGAYAASTLAPALILSGYTTLAASTIGTIVSTAVAVAGNAVIAATASKPSVPEQERRQTLRQPAMPRRVIYGQVRAGGLLVYASTSGDGNRYAHLVVALGEGEIDSVDPVFWIADKLSDDEVFDGLVTTEFKLGTHDQAASASLMAARPTDWTADHRLRGVAYAYVRFEFNANAFPAGLPQMSFLVRGRKVYDPRTETRVWSENPALCILDYLRTDPRAGEYFSIGLDAPDDMIDFDSFAAAANVCDEIVTSIDSENRVDGISGRVKRYTLNGIIDLSGSPASILEEMQSACAGRLVFAQGKYRFHAGAYDTPAATINGDSLRADPTIRVKPSRQDVFNVVRGKYTEPRQEWSETDYQPQIDSASVTANGEIVQDLSLVFTTNGATAQRLALQALNKAGASSLTLQCNWSALALRVWDVVLVDLPEIDLNERPFRVVQFSFAEGGGVDLVLRSESSADYAWTPADDETIVQDVVRPSFSDDEVAVPTSLTVSGAPRLEQYGTVPLISATWSYTPGPFFDHYEVQIKLTSDAEYTDSTIVTTPSFLRQLVTFEETYDVRVRAVNKDGRQSEWAEVTGTEVLNDTTAPDVPTALSVTGSGTHTINWTTPGNDDFRASRVYVNTINDSSGATLLISIVGLQLTAYSTTNTPGGTRYYWVASVDRTGNESALTYAGTAT